MMTLTEKARVCRKKALRLRVKYFQMTVDMRTSLNQLIFDGEKPFDTLYFCRRITRGYAALDRLTLFASKCQFRQEEYDREKCRRELDGISRDLGKVRSAWRAVSAWVEKDKETE